MITNLFGESLNKETQISFIDRQSIVSKKKTVHIMKY